MKLNRMQLRRLIQETMIRPIDPMSNIPAGSQRDKLSTLTGHEGEDMRRMGYSMAQVLQQNDDPNMLYSGDDYIDDVIKYDASKWINLMYQQIDMYPNLLESFDKFIGKYITSGSKIVFGWDNSQDCISIKVGNTLLTVDDFHLPGVASVFGEDSEEMALAIEMAQNYSLESDIMSGGGEFPASYDQIPTADNQNLVPMYLAIRAHEVGAYADFDSEFIGATSFDPDPENCNIEFYDDKGGYLIAQLSITDPKITIEGVQLSPECYISTDNDRVDDFEGL